MSAVSALPLSSGRPCSRCLLAEGMPLYVLGRLLPARLVGALAVDDAGVCSLCRAYEASFTEDARRAEAEEVDAELRAHGAPVVVAFSGGKDSLATLALARERGFDVVAVLLDNGFIPDEVTAQARRVCARAGAALEVVSLAGAEAEAFRATVEGARPDRPIPCSDCSKHIFRALEDAMERHGARGVFFGTNYFASWKERPSALHRFRLLSGRPVVRVHLPYLLGVTHERTLAIVASLEAAPVQVDGRSTNCRVPGLLRDAIGPRIGHDPALEDLALEVLVGHVPRDVALAQLRR